MAFIDSRKDKFFFHNTLLCLIKALEGKNIIIDLRNDTCVCGTIVIVDGKMNITMKDVIYCDPRGNEYKFEEVFIQSRNIRYVHVPESMPIIPTIKEALYKPKIRKNPEENKQLQKSRKRQKALAQHLEIVASL